MMITYCEASPSLLEKRWQILLERHPDDVRWKDWKEDYIQGHALGLLKTFLIMDGSQPIGEGTLIFDPRSSAIMERPLVSEIMANVNALRIDEAYEGKGYISTLMKSMEAYAYEKGYRYLSIGVNKTALRNRSIYQHFGFNTFLFEENEEDETIYYYCKEIRSR